VTKVKCLLVDDLEDNLLVLQALLRRDDVELLLARSGLEALDLLLEHDVALALVDVQMPEMDGFELAELMRGSERTRRIPLIFVTAGVRDQHRLFKGYDAGAVDFLYKPIEPVILQNKCEVFFQLYRQKQQIQHELRERTEALRLNEMFAAVLGHDLRSPLGAIMTSAQIVKRLSSDPVIAGAASRILSSGHHMTRMIEDLLDTTRARLGAGLPVSRESVDLAAIVARAVEQHAETHPGRPITVASAGDSRGLWDGVRIAQLLSNLIGNALEHGSRDAAVAIGLDGQHAACVTLTVSNAGAIAPEMVPHIFDPFRSGRQPGDRQGLGLGLYIAQEIARAHGGTITLESASGTTTFRVILPRHAGPQDRDTSS
jgi:two-component system sensor histidine kinase/response regulator